MCKKKPQEDKGANKLRAKISLYLSNTGRSKDKPNSKNGAANN